VRRHPDIKWLRREADLAGFAREQARLLDALWRLLAPDGKLLYVTCSVFAEENEAAVAAFLARRSGARRLALPGLGDGQLLPDDEHDGFFYAALANH
jgi:16S rRNA (cytosine967-C5)-methyltransferase